MLNEYRKFLISKGYAVEVNGRGSTVADYIRALRFVLKTEQIDINTLKANIETICPMYQKGHEKQILGAHISRSVRNSLKQYRLFVAETAA